MLSPNTLLHRRYRILRHIAAGGMGAVYEAHDERLNINVALKEALLPDTALGRAFEREAQRLARLRHSALPNVMDHFVEENGQYLVMEYIDGADLKERLAQQGGAFAVQEVLAWADGLLDLLSYLHAQEPPVIHRDIKPANLKLTPQGEIILLDFGIAKGGLTQMTSNDSVPAYTLSYAPPEQIAGEPTDARSDLYALAATLYHLLTGEAPKNALARFAANDPDFLRSANQLNRQVPAYVAQALASAMALDPAQRPANAAEMRKQLVRAASEPTTRPARPPQQSLDWPIVIAGLFFLALITVIVFGLTRGWAPDAALSTPTIVITTQEVTPTAMIVSNPTSTTPNATTSPTVNATERSLPPTPAGKVLLHTTLDDIASITAPAVGIGGMSRNLEAQDFVPAQVRHGAQFTKEGQLATFAIARGDRQNINLDQGEIEFWYRPNYEQTKHTGSQHTLFRVAIDGYNPPALQLSSGKELIFSATDGDWNQYHTSTPYAAPLWQVGEWVQIRAMWDNTNSDDSLQLYVNGIRVDRGGVRGGWKLEPTTNPLSIVVGAQTPQGHFIANGVIDEFIIREKP